MSDRATPGWGSGSQSSPSSDPGSAGPLDSDVAVGLLQRGQVLADQGDWDVAAATFTRVVGNDDPALHTTALLGLAECRYRMDEEEAALQAWISATQAPENELTWRAWKALAVARVRQNDVPGAARAYREAARRAPESEQPALQSRIGWLSKEMGEEGASNRAFGRSRTGLIGAPIATYSIIGVTALVSIIAEPAQSTELGQLFQLDKFAMYFDNEYWRLVTVGLLHGGLPHLFLNMMGLYFLGPIVEALYGPRRMVAMYVLCVAAGAAASYATSPWPGVGASGGVFGLAGILIVADRVHKPALTRSARNLSRTLMLVLGANLLIGFSAGTVTSLRIDNAAHIGGLIAGAILGFLLVPRTATLGSFWSKPAITSSEPRSPTETEPPDPATRTRRLRLAGVFGLVGAIVLLVAISPITWDPESFLALAGEPVAPTEPIGEQVRIATGQPSVIVGELTLDRS